MGSDLRFSVARNRMTRNYLPGSKTVFMTSAVLFVGFLGVFLKADSNLAATPRSGWTPWQDSTASKPDGDAQVYLREVMAKVQAEKARRGE